MKTLLIGVNAKYIHPNLAIRLLKANTTYETDIIEFNIKDTVEIIYKYITENHYEIVAFSCYIWNIKLIKDVLKKLQETKIITILGGPEVSYNALYYLDTHLAKFVIKNEGEEAFHQLLSFLHGNGILSDIPNLYYQKGYTFDRLVDISKSKMAYHLLDDVENKIVYLETSRGCPYHCGYCMASLDNKLRFFDIEEIKFQVLSLIGKGAKVFKFLDRTFNANKKNFLSLINFIILNYQKQNSFQFEITGDLLDEDIIHYINEHAPKNLFRFEIGIQSTNVKANQAVGRIQNNIKLFRNIRLIQEKAIIDLHLDLIAGLPYEDYKSFQNTFNEVVALRPKELQLGFLKLLFGTKLHEDAKKYGYIWQEEAPYEIISNDFMSAADIENIHICEDAFEKYYNSPYYKTTISFLLNYVHSPYEFFYDLGISYAVSKPTRLEDSFLLLDSFVKTAFPQVYRTLHRTLILEYCKHFMVKPKAWWIERTPPKEKKRIIRHLHEQYGIPYDLLTIYKHSLLIDFEKTYCIILYIEQTNVVLEYKK